MTNTQSTHLTDILDRLDQWDTGQLQYAVERLRSELRNRTDCDYLYESWHVDDILCRRPDLSVSECREVLRRLDRYQDATIGINWDVIDFCADDCYPAPDSLEELREQAEEDSYY